MKGYSKDTRQRVLAAMPGSSKQIAECAKVDKTTACVVIKGLMRDGMAHIGSWSLHTPIYAAGEGVDATAPFKAARKPDLENPPIAYSLRPRVDPMIWATAGRNAPGVHA